MPNSTSVFPVNSIDWFAIFLFLFLLPSLVLCDRDRLGWNSSRWNFGCFHAPALGRLLFLISIFLPAKEVDSPEWNETAEDIRVG